MDVVDQFVYLGTTIDKDLNFKKNAECVFKKAMQRMYLLRKLRNFGVSQRILQTVYRSLIESILTFNMSVWYGILGRKELAMLARIVNYANKITGIPQIPLSALYTSTVRKKALKISNDETHPLSIHFKLLPSTRRYRVPKCKKCLLRKSFLPNAVSILNS